MVFGVDVPRLMKEVPPILLLVAIQATALHIFYGDALAMEPPAVIAKSIQRSPETLAALCMSFPDFHLQVRVVWSIADVRGAEVAPCFAIFLTNAIMPRGSQSKSTQGSGNCGEGCAAGGVSTRLLGCFGCAGTGATGLACTGTGAFSGAGVGAVNRAFLAFDSSIATSAFSACWVKYFKC